MTQHHSELHRRSEQLSAAGRLEALFALNRPLLGKVSATESACFCIAEIGVNHNGQLVQALELIKAAAKAGADAVKFQLFDPDELVSQNTPLAHYQERSQSSESSVENQADMLHKLCLPREVYPELKRYAENLGLVFLCSPFDEESARYLIQDLDIQAIKLGSGELTNIPLLQSISRYCEASGKPILLSTGMSHIGEIWNALVAIGKTSPVAILHCTSAYPAPAKQLNLRAIQTLRELFPNRVIGYSDHSLSPLSSPMAVSLGAQIIEKHLTLDTTQVGPDHAASLNPNDFALMVHAIRDVEAMLGNGEKQAQPCEEDCIRVARKSLVSRNDLPVGHVLTEADFAIKRPGTGLSPAFRDRLIGQTLQKAITANCVFTAGHFAQGLQNDTPQPLVQNPHPASQHFPLRLSYSTRQLSIE